MDVNGSRYHLLQTAGEWQALIAAAGANLNWDAARQAVVFDKQAVVRRSPRQQEASLTVADHRGASIDAYGSIYWIGPDRRSIYFLPEHAKSAEVYWSIAQLQQTFTANDSELPGGFRATATLPPEPFTALAGLAVTCDHYLLAGTLKAGGLLIFDLRAGGMPVWVPWPEDTAFNPRDMSLAEDGILTILDVDAASGGAARLWRVDSRFRLLPDNSDDIENNNNPFAALELPAEPSPVIRPLRKIAATMAHELGILDAVALENLGMGLALVLEFIAGSPGQPFIHVVSADPKLASPSVSIEVTDPVDMQAHDLIFRADTTTPAADEINGTLYLCDRSGNQSFAFRLQFKFEEGAALQLQLYPLPQYLPMRGFTGAALIQNARGVYYLSGQRWLPLLEQPQQRYQTEGILDGIILDSGQIACVWHRLFVDACIPGDSNIRILTRSAERREWLAQEEFTPEPPLYFRRYGPELPKQLPRSPGTSVGQSEEGDGSWEVLLQNATGRFLEIRLHFTGSGRSTPALRALRVYFPRFSYLREYLPAIYRDEPVSANFLDRYLANVEGLFTEMEGRIADMDYLFDSRTTPEEFLQWLAGWLGVVFDPEWDAARRRLFLRYAPLLYRWRGTLIGLRAMIGMAITICPDETLFAELQAVEQGRNPNVFPTATVGWGIRIIERFRLRNNSAAALGKPDDENAAALGIAAIGWRPEQGAAPLNIAYRSFLSANFPNRQFTEAESAFPATLPVDQQLSAAWRYFLTHYLDFHYAVVDRANFRDRDRYREFLARRYGDAVTLNQAYGLAGDAAWAAFQAIELPAQLPADGIALREWIEFVSGVMAVKRNAFRFSVLAPAYIDEAPEARRLRLEKVREVVNREKPAHTDFDVDLYWALFRVGSARLQLDSIVGEGSRYVAMVLNREYLGGSFVAAEHPFNVKDRFVTDRDRL